MSCLKFAYSALWNVIGLHRIVVATLFRLFTVQSWAEFVPLGEKRKKKIKFQTSLGAEVKSIEIQNVAMTAKSWMSENETLKGIWLFF